MTSFLDLYKDCVKHLRVIRNISKGHKQALGISEIEPDNMTPYERGRMTRSCTRLGNNLEFLLKQKGQEKIVFALSAYVYGIGVRPIQFRKHGDTTWTCLYKEIEDMFLNGIVDVSDLADTVGRVGTLLDQPVTNMPNQLLLLKLSI